MESEIIAEMIQKNDEKNAKSEELFINVIIHLKIIFVLISIIMNTIIILIALYRVRTKKYTDYIVLFVSSSDSLFSLVTVLFWSQGRLSLQFPILYNDFSCILWNVNDYTTISMNSLNLFELLFHFYRKSINRNEQNTDQLTKKRLTYLICSWIVKYLYSLLLSIFLIQNVSYQLSNCSISHSFVYYMLFDKKFFNIPLFYLVFLNLSFFLACAFEKSRKESSKVRLETKQIEEELLYELNSSLDINPNNKSLENNFGERFRLFLLKYRTFLTILIVNVLLHTAIYVFQPFEFGKFIQIVYLFTYLFSNTNPLFILYLSAQYYQEFKNFLF